MTKDVYLKNIDIINQKFPVKGSPERESALKYLNDKYKAEETAPKISAPTVAPPAQVEQERGAVTSDPRLTGWLGSPEQQIQRNQKELADREAFNNMSTTEQVANQVGKIANVGMGLGTLATAAPVIAGGGLGMMLGSGLRPFLANWAKGGLGYAGKKAVVPTAKAAARVAGTVAPTVGANVLSRELVEQAGGGEQLQNLVGTLAGVGTGIASNSVVNKFLPQAPQMNYPKQNNMQGPKIIQKAHEKLEGLMTPGGPAAWMNPQAAESVQRGRVLSEVRANELRTPMNKAFREVDKFVKKNKADKASINKLIKDYIKDPVNKEVFLPDELRNNKTFMDNLTKTRAGLKSLSQKEISYTSAKDDAWKLFKDTGAKKNDVIEQVAKWVENPNSIPNQTVQDKLQEFLRGANRSPEAKKALLNGLRTSKAQRGSIDWKEAVDEYLPTRYMAFIEGEGWRGDPLLKEEAIFEYMQNNPKASARQAEEYIDRIVSKRQYGRPPRGATPHDFAGINSPTSTINNNAARIANTKSRVLDDVKDEALMRYLGVIDDPEFLLGNAIDTVSTKIGARTTINDLVKQGVLSRNASEIPNSIMLTGSGSNDMGSFDDIIASMVDDINIPMLPTGEKGGAYYVDPTISKLLFKPERPNTITRIMDNTTNLIREAKVIENLPGQFRNRGGDLLATFNAGANPVTMPKDIKWAMQNIRKINNADDTVDVLAKAFRENGVMSGGFARGSAKAPMGTTANTIAKKRGESFLERAPKAIYDKIKNSAWGKFHTAFAEGGEDVTRMAFARDRFRALGGNEAAGFDMNTAAGRNNMAIVNKAVRQVDDVLHNYQFTSPLVKGMNKVAPVSSWTAMSYAKTPNLFLANPGRYAASGTAMHGVSSALEPYGVDINWPQALPMGGLVQTGIDTMRGMPKGEALYDNLANEFSMGLSPWALLTANLGMGQDVRGFPVRNEWDSLPKQATDTALNLASHILPGTAQQFLPYASPRGDYLNAVGGPVWNRAAGITDDRFGELRTTTPEMIARLLGVQLLRDDPNAWTNKLIRQQRVMSEAMSRINSAKSESEYNKYLKQYMTQMQKMEALSNQYNRAVDNQRAGGN